MMTTPSTVISRVDNNHVDHRHKMASPKSRSGYNRSQSPNGLQAAKYNSKFQGASCDDNKWWTGIIPQNVSLSLNNNISSYLNNEKNWDVSDSLKDLYHRVNNQSKYASNTFRKNSIEPNIDAKSWFDSDNTHGFIRVFPSENTLSFESQLIPCNTTTTSERICSQRGMPPNSLHVQLNGDTIRRLEPTDCPLAIQNDYLVKIGYSDVRRIQEIGISEDFSYLVRFHAGKPFYDGTYSRNELSTYLWVRKGKILHEWAKRLCTICGTRLSIYKERAMSGKALEVQLAKGRVEEVKVRGHDMTLKLTSTIQGVRSVYLSFTDIGDYNRWLKKAIKATSKLPTRADLSYCHLEILPDTIFINDGLQSLNLRHNALRERPIDEDVFTIGWLDDLTRFFNLSYLNLADNDLHHFPHCIIQIPTLVDLNLASNQIDELPAEIVQLVNLQILDIHNNHLTTLPNSLTDLHQLDVLIIAFNHFTSIPNCLLMSNDTKHPAHVLSLVMSGNFIETIPPETLAKMCHFNKIDLRLNRLHLLPQEMVKLGHLDLVTHLDLRDNRIINLDIRGMKKLQLLLCDHCEIETLQISGVSVKSVSASYNRLKEFVVTPKPEWLSSLNLSHNSLDHLPVWLSSCFFLVKLNISHNNISTLPHRLLEGCSKLKILTCDHNSIHTLDEPRSNFNVEELYCQRNQITQLPEHFLINAIRLRVLNMSHNQLTMIPPINDNDTLNKIQELYLSCNLIQDNSMKRICGYSRLRVLHLAYNCIHKIHNRDLCRLEQLQELCLSGNYLSNLPSCLSHHSKLCVLRANSNNISRLPDFTHSPLLKVLEVSSNCLMNVSMCSLVPSQLNLLDLSHNPGLHVERSELDEIQEHKRIVGIDTSGRNRTFHSLSNQSPSPTQSLTNGSEDQAWTVGYTKTTGNRNKLCVDVLCKPAYTNNDDSLFCVFDGGRNDAVTKILHNNFAAILKEEMDNKRTNKDYMKYAVLSAHKKLGLVGQKLGASIAVCHISKQPDSHEYDLHIANVGDVAIVLGRRGNCDVITRSHTVSRDSSDCERILKNDGVITEDGRVYGITHNTRLIGSTYLYPQIIPHPHTATKRLSHDTELIIIANHGLWQYVQPQEAVNEIWNIELPIIAAKKLQDLAQGYGSKENIAVVVVRLDLPVVVGGSWLGSCSTLKEGGSVSDVSYSGGSLGGDDHVVKRRFKIGRDCVADNNYCDMVVRNEGSNKVMWQIAPNKRPQSDIVVNNVRNRDDLSHTRPKSENLSGGAAGDGTVSFFIGPKSGIVVESENVVEIGDTSLDNVRDRDNRRKSDSYVNMMSNNRVKNDNSLYSRPNSDIVVNFTSDNHAKIDSYSYSQPNGNIVENLNSDNISRALTNGVSRSSNDSLSSDKVGNNTKGGRYQKRNNRVKTVLTSKANNFADMRCNTDTISIQSSNSSECLTADTSFTTLSGVSDYSQNSEKRGSEINRDLGQMKFTFGSLSGSEISHGLGEVELFIKKTAAVSYDYSDDTKYEYARNPDKSVRRRPSINSLAYVDLDLSMIKEDHPHLEAVNSNDVPDDTELNTSDISLGRTFLNSDNPLYCSSTSISTTGSEFQPIDAVENRNGSPDKQDDADVSLDGSNTSGYTLKVEFDNESDVSFKNESDVSFKNDDDPGEVSENINLRSNLPSNQKLRRFSDDFYSNELKEKGASMIDVIENSYSYYDLNTDDRYASSNTLIAESSDESGSTISDNSNITDTQNNFATSSKGSVNAMDDTKNRFNTSSTFSDNSNMVDTKNAFNMDGRESKESSNFPKYSDNTGITIEPLINTARKPHYASNRKIHNSNEHINLSRTDSDMDFVDRDAILFHHMQQMTRAQRGSSLVSVTSVPDGQRSECVRSPLQGVSHSIEVIVGPSGEDFLEDCYTKI